MRSSLPCEAILRHQFALFPVGALGETRELRGGHVPAPKGALLEHRVEGRLLAVKGTAIQSAFSRAAISEPKMWALLPRPDGHPYDTFAGFAFVHASRSAQDLIGESAATTTQKLISANDATQAKSLRAS
jgi:hypothetical protein